MNSIPDNVWGSAPFKTVNQISQFRVSQDVLIPINDQAKDQPLVVGKSHWWNILPQKILPKFLLKGWNEIVYRLGYVTVISEGKPTEIKVTELKNKLLLNPKTIHKAVVNNTVKNAIDTQMVYLDSLRDTGVIQDPPEVWADKVIKLFGIKEKRNYTETSIRIHLVPSQVNYYHILQLKIADIVPNEWDRPAIEVEISKPGAKIEYTCCVGGGVGPLSDAEIVNKAVKKMKMNKEGEDPWDRARIVVYSAPSPMRGIKQLHNLPKLFPWWNRVQAFFSRWYNIYKDQTTSYIIASNTAHVHMPKLSPIAKDHLMNVVVSFAKGIKEHNKGNKAVLILGTSEAYEKKLYPTVFEQEQIPFANIDADAQKSVQEIINLTKANRLTAEDNSHLLDIIRENVKANPPRYLLLGCTELPMALKDDKKFEDLARKSKIIVIDTEDIIALQIALNVMNRSKPGKEENAMLLWLNEQKGSL